MEWSSGGCGCGCECECVVGLIGLLAWEGCVVLGVGCWVLAGCWLGGCSSAQ